MRKNFLIYEEMLKHFESPYIRRPLVIYDFATAPLWISLYMRKLWFSFFISVHTHKWIPVSWACYQFSILFCNLLESSSYVRIGCLTLSLIPAANLPLVCWHRWLTCEYLREFSKKFELTLMLFSGAWGKVIHEKTLSKKSRDTVPLSYSR